MERCGWLLWEMQARTSAARCTASTRARGRSRRSRILAAKSLVTRAPSAGGGQPIKPRPLPHLALAVTGVECRVACDPHEHDDHNDLR
jgi:hypothetical protein